jgi:hypothetical protein
MWGCRSADEARVARAAFGVRLRGKEKALDDGRSKRIERATNTAPTSVQYMRVDHRRLDTRVTEQLLHGSNIVARLQQMGGERMSQDTIEVSRFVNKDQPGFVECVLIDAAGTRHLFIEKGPIVSDEDLWSTSDYPCSGAIPCVIESEWRDEDGRAVARIDTNQPLDVESTTGRTKFVVLYSQLVAA